MPPPECVDPSTSYLKICMTHHSPALVRVLGLPLPLPRPLCPPPGLTFQATSHPSELGMVHRPPPHAAARSTSQAWQLQRQPAGYNTLGGGGGGGVPPPPLHIQQQQHTMGLPAHVGAAITGGPAAQADAHVPGASGGHLPSAAVHPAADSAAVHPAAPPAAAVEPGVVPLRTMHASKGKEFVCNLRLDPFPIEQLPG